MFYQNKKQETTEIDTCNLPCFCGHSYAAQVWGTKKNKQVDNLTAFYLKKLYRIPIGTPNFKIVLELKESGIYSHILDLSRHYNSKVEEMRLKIFRTMNYEEFMLCFNSMDNLVRYYEEAKALRSGAKASLRSTEVAEGIWVEFGGVGKERQQINLAGKENITGEIKLESQRRA
ncbi:hypothetical protein AAG570_008520 [Ranatra chinensis]|uniref:Uncharacterized protein n=1 Tax=Ranatra chinensis TaxID=642074 RepID=A0ABD0YRS1_9HEMI